MARVLRGFAPEPPVVFVILSEAKYLKLNKKKPTYTSLKMTWLDFPSPKGEKGRTIRIAKNPITKI